MADNPAEEAARKQLAADKEARARSDAEFAERMKGKPTPTQEENDFAVMGAPVFDKEDDGSGPDPNMTPKHAEARPGGAAYQTRQARPATPALPRRE